MLWLIHMLLETSLLVDDMGLIKHFCVKFEGKSAEQTDAAA